MILWDCDVGLCGTFLQFCYNFKNWDWLIPEVFLQVWEVCRNWSFLWLCLHHSWLVLQRWYSRLVDLQCEGQCSLSNSVLINGKSQVIQRCLHDTIPNCLHDTIPSCLHDTIPKLFTWHYSQAVYMTLFPSFLHDTIPKLFTWPDSNLFTVKH